MLIVKVPGVNAPGRPLGSELGGVKVLECLKNEIHSSDKGKVIDYQKLDLEHIHVDNSNVQEAQELIFKNSKEMFEKQDKVLFLGGDHSISYPVCKGFFEIYPEGRLIVFDAHPDCMPAMKEADHESWLRKIVEEFGGDRVLLVGARNSYADELRFLKEKEVKVVGMNQLLLDLESMTDFIMEFSGRKALYVSLDIDVVDPAFAPGTGYKEPGGLSAREIIYIMQRIAMMKNLRGFDLVEINPRLDDFGGEIDGKGQRVIDGAERFGRTVKLGARILGEMI